MSLNVADWDGIGVGEEVGIKSEVVVAKGVGGAVDGNDVGVIAVGVRVDGAIVGLTGGSVGDGMDVGDPTSNALRCCIRVVRFPSDQKSTMTIAEDKP